MAVVDQHRRMHGVDGLRVADASIGPYLARADTNAAADMTGEKPADGIKAGE